MTKNAIWFFNFFHEKLFKFYHEIKWDYYSIKQIMQRKLLEFMVFVGLLFESFLSKDV